MADHSEYFGRVNLNLDGAANTLPTDLLVESYAIDPSGANLALEQLYFQYGRYLSIASSRDVPLPSNLQGIWNNSSTPPWHSDIHANINVQMNSSAMRDGQPPGDAYAISRIYSSMRPPTSLSGGSTPRLLPIRTEGWTCLTENNIFGAISGFAPNYVIANAWYCTHLWQHYLYTLDKDFLKRAFPAMLSATQFWIDRLKRDRDGTYVAPKEYSPEQGPAEEDGVAHAQQLVYELFANTLDAIAVLGDEAEISAQDYSTLVDRFKQARPRPCHRDLYRRVGRQHQWYHHRRCDFARVEDESLHSRRKRPSPRIASHGPLSVPIRSMSTAHGLLPLLTRSNSAATPRQDGRWDGRSITGTRSRRRPCPQNTAQCPAPLHLL